LHCELFSLKLSAFIRQTMQVKTFPAVLKDAYMLSPKVKHFVFQIPEQSLFNFSPGQFITIHFEKNNTVFRRSYSIANSPQQNNILELAAGYVENGPGTELLFNLNPGDSVQMNGPFGRLILKDNIPKRYILVATSTGITPYRAMIPELKKRLQNYPALEVVLLQGTQTRDDVLYGDEFKTLAAEFPRFNFRIHLSRETRELEDFEYAGYVQLAFPELQLDPHSDLVYLCGNPSMIDEAFEYLKTQNFAIQNIIREKYISR
jgi:ferredoxin-NADP reductase